MRFQQLDQVSTLIHWRCNLPSSCHHRRTWVNDNNVIIISSWASLRRKKVFVLPICRDNCCYYIYKRLSAIINQSINNHHWHSWDAKSFLIFHLLRPLFLLTKSSSKRCEKRTTWSETIQKGFSAQFNGGKTCRSAKA